MRPWACDSNRHHARICVRMLTSVRTVGTGAPLNVTRDIAIVDVILRGYVASFMRTIVPQLACVLKVVSCFDWTNIDSIAYNIEK